MVFISHVVEITLQICEENRHALPFMEPVGQEGRRTPEQILPGRAVSTT